VLAAIFDSLNNSRFLSTNVFFAIVIPLFTSSSQHPSSEKILPKYLIYLFKLLSGNGDSDLSSALFEIDINFVFFTFGWPSKYSSNSRRWRSAPSNLYVSIHCVAEVPSCGRLLSAFNCFCSPPPLVQIELITSCNEGVTLMGTSSEI